MRPASRGQPIGLGIIDGRKHVARGLHAAEMLSHGLRISVAGKAAIGDGTRRELTDQVASVLLRDQPMAERGPEFLMVVEVVSQRRVSPIVDPPIASD